MESVMVDVTVSKEGGLWMMNRGDRPDEWEVVPDGVAPEDAPRRVGRIERIVHHGRSIITAEVEVA